MYMCVFVFTHHCLRRPVATPFVHLYILLLLLLLTAIESSLGGSNPYTSTDKTNKNKYT